VFNHAALPGQMHITRRVHSCMCQALQVRQLASQPQKIGSSCTTATLATKSWPFCRPKTSAPQPQVAHPWYRI